LGLVLACYATFTSVRLMLPNTDSLLDVVWLDCSRFGE